MKNKKIIYTIGAIASLISIVVVYYLYDSFNAILNLKAMGDLPPKEVEEILSRTIATPRYIIQFLSSIIVLLITITIASFLLSRKVTGIDKAFAISLLFFGGIGISAVIALISILKRKEISFKIKPARRFAIIGTTSAALITPVCMLAIAGSTKGVDNPTIANDVKFSINPKTPNLVEIFTDGFDARAMQELLDSSKHPENTNKFPDFTGLVNFLTPGFITNDSIPAQLSNDYKFANPFMAHHLVKNDSALNYEYKNWFPKYAMNKLNSKDINNGIINPKTYHRHLINPTSLSDTNSYMPHVSGNPKYLTNTFDKSDDKNYDHIQIVNWGQAKNNMASSFGISNKSSDGQFYGWLNKNSYASNDKNSKGEYLWMQDSITHTPHNGGENNILEWNSKYNKYQRVLDNLSGLVSHLRDIGTYDNTMIVIYGDHSDHSRTAITEDDNHFIRGNRSFGMVKYPNDKHAFTLNKSNAYFSTDINEFISKYFNDIEQPNPSKYLENQKFNFKRKFRIYDGANKTALTHLVKRSHLDEDKDFFFDYEEEIIDKDKGKDGWERYKDIVGNKTGDDLIKAIEGLAI